MEAARLSLFRNELERKIQGDLLFDRMSRLLYSTDASLYQIMPLGVVLPRTKEDVVQAVRTASKHRIPVLPRGGGTSLAGQTVTEGLVIDCSRYLNRVLEINEKERWALVEPGVVLDNLNDRLAPFGLFFAPDVATSSRANIGGMIGNNSAGVRSIRYGKTVDHVLELKVILSTGEELTLSALEAATLDEICSRSGREGDLYRGIREIVEENRQEIESRFPKVLRRVGGYNLDELIGAEPFNLAKLIVGSEGTLAFVTEARLHLEKIPEYKVLAVLHFDDLIRSLEAVPEILRHQPTAVEVLDAYGLELARQNPSVARLQQTFVKGSPAALLVVEFSGCEEAQIQESMQRLRTDPMVKECCRYIHEAWEQEAQSRIWQVRKSALGVMLGIKGDFKPLPFIEDACVPVEHLSRYIAEILDICRRFQRRVALYAHASVGVVHVRPLLNLKQEEDLRLLEAISEKAFEQVLRFGGSWSGEHGDGLVRSYKNREFFGPVLYQAFRRVKGLFDPLGLLNPGKIVDSPHLTEHLRIFPGYRTSYPPTHYRFDDFQGFDRAIEMCTGVGHCRKTLSGTMCPSYMATRREEDSTRGRANALRSAISGDLGADGFTSKRLFEVLDLCLECKACKTECPSNVDMARLKAEFLAHYYEKHGMPLGKRIFSSIRSTAQIASRAPRLFNFGVGNPVARWLLEKSLGIDRRRKLPAYSERTLTAWSRARNRTSVPRHNRSTVLLMADTFTNYFHPQTGIAALRLLQALDFDVEIIDPGCCGRPLISSGQLELARRQGARMLDNLYSAVERDLPILVLEPSCFATIRDDFPDLMENRQRCLEVVKQLTSLEEFLARDSVDAKLRQKTGKGPANVLFHGHCQQKSLIGTDSSLKALQSLKESHVSEIDSGCCGMAGSFGYEKQHYAISEQIGALRLFPAVKNAGPDTEIVACGFSCRAQIEHFTGRTARHLAEVLADSLLQDDSAERLP